MVKKKIKSNLSSNLFIILGIVFGIVLIFSLTNYVFPKKITGYQTSDNDKSLEGTEPPHCPFWEKNRDSEISKVKLAWDVVDCVDRDPKDDCEDKDFYDTTPQPDKDEGMDCGYGHSCCWAVCGTSLFMGDFDFSKSNKDKEAEIRGMLEKAKITFNNVCSYDKYPVCADGGCGTCVGGLKRETIYSILS